MRLQFYKLITLQRGLRYSLTMKSIFLDVLPEAFSIVRFPSSHIVPKWVEQSRIYSLTRSENELSIVCETKVLPNDISFRNDGWRALRVRGTLDFSLTGILSAIAFRSDWAFVCAVTIILPNSFK